jgi:drug/metabolite transporter (DMT)-like permease
VFVERQLKKDGDDTSIFEQQISLYGYGVVVNSLVLLLQGGMTKLYPASTAKASLGSSDGTFSDSSSTGIATALDSASSTLAPTLSPNLAPPSLDGWNVYATLLVLLFSVLGLLTAGVVKHQSSIVKMFANNTALILTVIFNSLIFGKTITLRFVLAVVNLIIAVILYHVASGVELVKRVETLPDSRLSPRRISSPREHDPSVVVSEVDEVHSLLHES